MKYDVFISYSRKDAAIVDRIETELKKYGIACFIDRTEIDLGDDFAEIIAKSIFESEILLFVWSENSNQSENTANEIALAIDFEKTIISFKIGKFQPHYKLAYRLVRFNRIDSLTYNEEQIIDLGAKVAKRLGRTLVKSVAAAPATDTAQPSAPQQPEGEIIDAELEPDYRQGIAALREFKLSKAFDLLYPLALAGYRRADEYLYQITRGKTRMYKLTDKQIAAVKEDADNGIATAQYIMGCYYKSVNPDPKAAFEYTRKAAEAELPAAIGLLAYFYDLGIGTDADHDKYMKNILLAVKMGDITAKCDIARNYASGWSVERDLNRAEAILLELEELEDPESINFLGYLHHDAKFNRVDLKKAEHYFKKAVSLGHIESYNDLALLYGFDSNNCCKDGKIYIETLQKGAEFDEVKCLSGLALAYSHGVGVKQNHKLALRWAERAAKNGDPFSYYLMGTIYYYGNDEIAQDYDKAWSYLAAGRKMISHVCTYMLGQMCYDGNGREGFGKKDCIAFLEEAVLLGEQSSSPVLLYRIYSDGEIVEKDMNKAVEHLKVAVENRDPAACVLYGKLLTDQKSDFFDEFKGVKYLQIAAEANNWEAVYLLGDIFRQGIGLPEDYDKGVEYVRRAADEGRYGRAQLAMGDILSHLNESDNEWYNADRDAKLSDEQIESDRRQAILYAEMAVDDGYNYGHRLINNIYWEMASKKDYNDETLNKEWFDWLSDRCDKFPDSGHYTMAVMYDAGIGTSVDLGKAAEHYKAAYDAGNENAAGYLADVYDRMNNPLAAAEWRKKKSN